jgi:WXG100 family type VII secretion target
VAQTAAEAAIMDSTASKFNQAQEGLDAMLNRLLGELEILQTHFVGRAGRSFQSVKEAYQANQKKLAAALDETATAIRNSGTTYTNTDDEASSKVSGINVGMNLPL